MTDEPTIPNPGGESKDSGDQPTDYVSRRAAELRKDQEPKETKAEVQEEEAEEQEEQVNEPEDVSETPNETETQSDDDKDVLSQFDFDQFDEESSQELGRQLAAKLGDKVADFAIGLGSKSGQEIAKMRSELREITEERDKLKAGWEKAAPNSNAFAHISDPKELEQTETQLVQLYDYYDRVAKRNEWESDDNGDEGIYDQGKFYPKEKMLDLLDEWKIQLRAIPERKTQLQKRGSVKQERDKTAKILTEKMEWFGDKDTDESKTYSELMGNPSVVSALQILPDLEPMLMEAFAHTVEGRKGKVRKKIELPLNSKKKPAGGGDNGAAGSSRQKPKGLQQAEKRVAEGNYSPDDWAAVRAEKYKGMFSKP